MDIYYLIQLLTNRLTALNLAKDQAFQAGDLERINTLDTEISDVQNTLAKLRLLYSIEQTAANTPFTEAQVVQHGIDVSTGLGTVNGGSTSCLEEYDISLYATDPLHDQKIRDILDGIGYMDSAAKVDDYIKNAYPESPVTGDMIMRASGAYAVDARLMMALMELDSRFGTVGVGARTFNPGNVGNTGEETRTYASWEDGVAAVALWLSNHRKAKISTPIPPTVPAVEPVVVEPTPAPLPTPSPEPQPTEVPPQPADTTSASPTPDTGNQTPSTTDTPTVSGSTETSGVDAGTVTPAPTTTPTGSPVSMGRDIRPRGRNIV